MRPVVQPNNHSVYGYQDPYPTNGSWRPTRGGNRGGYSSRGGYRGGRAPTQIRNRTLVLNGNNPTLAEVTNGTSPSEDSGRANASGSSYVTKTDRHLQLINTKYFEKDSQNRAKAIEETRKQKLKQRDEREKAKFSKHLQRLGTNSMVTNAPLMRSTEIAGNYEINVQGLRFRVTQNGSKLVKIPGEIRNIHEGRLSALCRIMILTSCRSNRFPKFHPQNCLGRWCSISQE